MGAINRLSAREQTIIRMRFGLNDAKGEEKTQKEVADILGISQSYMAGKEDHAETEKGNAEVFLMNVNACKKCRKMTNIQKI